MTYQQLHEATKSKYFDELPRKLQKEIETMRPHYKEMWESKCRDQKIVIGGCLVMVGISIGCLAGSIARNKDLVRQNVDLQYQVQTGLNMSVQYADREELLNAELASCSAKLKEKKLSPKAKAHVQQQPLVVEKIKQTFAEDWVDAVELYSRESSLNPLAINPSSGACGIVQSLPCNKLTNQCSLSDIDCQLRWGKRYISSRYGSVKVALAFHDQRGWY